MLNGRMHGGHRPAAPNGNRIAFKARAVTYEAIASRREVAALLRSLKSLACSIG
jgi:hypothetical protein